MSVADIFKNAIMQTILGMGVVFSILIFIAFIISLFKYLPDLLAKFNKSKKQNCDIVNQNVESILPTNLRMDEGVIVAVITAAIRAALHDEEPSNDSYFVRSIRRI